MLSRLLLLILPLWLVAQSPNLLLLKVYHDQNLSGWVMSEKLDGVRAYWDGEQLLSRSGRVIHAPAWFTAGYPPFAIDGELWSRRGDFEHILSVVNDQHPSEGWREITHRIFDVPHAQGGLLERLSTLKPYMGKVIKIIPQIPIQNRQHLQQFLMEIEQKGGEGVVVRDPHVPYIAKRTDKALKVKTFLDKECTIIAHNLGHGNYRGILGSVTCEMDNNVTFKIGSGFTRQERENPPPIGSQITFKYQSITKYGKPRFPIFLRVRP